MVVSMNHFYFGKSNESLSTKLKFKTCTYSTTNCNYVSIYTDDKYIIHSSLEISLYDTGVLIKNHEKNLEYAIKYDSINEISTKKSTLLSRPILTIYFPSPNGENKLKFHIGDDSTMKMMHKQLTFAIEKSKFYQNI
ncbi:hypothetical protein A3Q56_07068, partial [Intoshia linei]